MTLLLAAIPAAFLIGSIPFGLLLARTRGIDIREHGSGNIGATNVWRVLGRPLGLTCFVLDVGKGLVPVAVAGQLAGVLGSWNVAPGLGWAWLAVAFAAIAGHVFCPWIGFKGGKGVATGLGALLGVFPLVTLPAVAAFVLWGAVVGVWRYVGVASVAAAWAVPIFAAIAGVLFSDEPTVGGLAPFVGVTGLLAVLVTIRHKGNLQRTLRGTEPRVFSSKNRPERSAD